MAEQARLVVGREAPDQCGQGRHRVQVAGLRLQSLTERDAWLRAAAASDPQAQRWLGWRDQFVVPGPHRWRMLKVLPAGQGPIPPPRPEAPWGLIAVSPSSRRLAGSITVQATGQIGGSLAPGFRGRGLGTALFGGAAEFASELAARPRLPQPANLAHHQPVASPPE